MDHYKRRALVKIRRGENWPVKPEAEAIDGKTLWFTRGWVFTQEESALYAGETTWIISREEWPNLAADAPIWIAEGDLVFEEGI